MAKLFFKIKKPYFWPISPLFVAKKVFTQNQIVMHRTSYRFLAPCQSPEKFNDPISRKHPDRRQEAKMDRP